MSFSVITLNSIVFSFYAVMTGILGDLFAIQDFVGGDELIHEIS